MTFYHQPKPQRISPMYKPTTALYQRDSNAYQGASPWCDDYTQFGAATYYYPNYVDPNYPAVYNRMPPPPVRRDSPTTPPSIIYIQNTPYEHTSLPSEHPLLSIPSSEELIYEIHDADVLCGRGAPTHRHAGNQYFRSLVDRFQSSYLAARRVEKPEIASQLVELIRERGGRFLKRTKIDGVGPSGHFCWIDIGEQRAYEKACQSLREGAPHLRRSLAAKEVASAALCLDTFGRYRSVEISISEESYVEERDDRNGERE